MGLICFNKSLAGVKNCELRHNLNSDPNTPFFLPQLVKLRILFIHFRVLYQFNNNQLSKSR